MYGVASYLYQLYTVAGLIVYTLTAISLFIKYGTLITDKIRGIAGVRNEKDLISWLMFLKCDAVASLYRLRNYYLYPEASNTYKYTVILLVFLPVCAIVSYILAITYVDQVSVNIFFIFMGTALISLLIIPLSPKEGIDLIEMKDYIDSQNENPRGDISFREFSDEVKKYSIWKGYVLVSISGISVLVSSTLSVFIASIVGHGLESETLRYIIPDIISAGFLIFVVFFWALTVSLARGVDHRINDLFLFIWPKYVELDLRMYVSKQFYRENGILSGMDRHRLILSKFDGHTSMVYIKNIVGISFIEKEK